MRLTKRSNKTVHENGVCCTHFRGKECSERMGECTDNCPWEEAVWSKLADYEDAEEQCIAENQCGLRELLLKWKEFFDDIAELYDYRAIGTVSEFREAMFFKKYFMELYGEGLEVANWHLNGDLELLDNFIDEAVERGKQEESGEHDE